MLTAKDIMRVYDDGISRRANFVPVWDEIYKYYLPRRMGMHDTPETQGRDRSVKIYDGTPGASLLRLAAVINSTITNQSTNWFLFETDDEELNEDSAVKSWLDHDRNAARKAIENSNFYQQMMEFYIDLCGPGTAGLYVDEAKQPDKDLYFSTRHLRELVVMENDQGEIDGVFMCRNMSAYQIMARWRHARISGTIPEKVRRAMDGNKPGERFEVLHAVYANDDFSDGNELDPRKFRYASVWVFKELESEIDRGGYHEMPAIVEFWSKASAEQYGRGPAWDALADVKSLYSMKKSLLRVGHMAYEPPLTMPHSTVTYPVSLRPGGLIYYDAAARHAPAPLQTGQGFPIGREIINDERNQVRDWFYVTQLQLIDARVMTAEEVRARTTDNAKILGPTFGRLNTFLDRMFTRVLGILRRRNKLAPIPEVVRQAAKNGGLQLKVKFVSPIVKAAALGEVQGIVHTMATAIDWAANGQRPDVMDNFDLDYGIRKISELDGAPPEFLIDKRKVDALRKMRQAAAERMEAERQAEQRVGLANNALDAQTKFIDTKQRSMGGGLNG